MALDFSLYVRIDGKELDARLSALLEALHAHGSLAEAARRVGCSYRHAWDRLQLAQAQFGQALVVLERGRGARLSAFGSELVKAQTRARGDTRVALARIARETEQAIGRPHEAAAASLVIAASHDLALIELKRFCAVAPIRVGLELNFRGSLDALAELARGRCELAGFHLSPQAGGEAELRRALSPRQHLALVLAKRRQGLMVAPGNPKKLRTLADLGRRGTRFVNRQPGSGTRLLFESLLARSGRVRGDIRGYETEEFTHVAVAATIASGHADAGLGIEAAAAAYGLDFIPLTHETYYLALQRSRIQNAAVGSLVSHMKSAPWRRRLARLAGYDGADCGTLVEVDEMLRDGQRRD